MDRITTELQTVCPYCGYQHDAHTGIEGDTVPSVDDVSICWKCTMIAEYAETPESATLTLRPVTSARYDQLMLDPDLARVLSIVREARRLSNQEKN